MKEILRSLLLLLIVQSAGAQVVTKAGFGVDGDLRCNFYNNFGQPGTDDWFYYPGSNKHVIDTTGAAAMLARYGWDLDFRKLPFYRTMSVAPYTLLMNKLAIDAVFIRDYHGSDSTIFASGSNKNGMSPADWQCPEAQSIPDKNDILDMMVHVRREGPTVTDSLWLFGGLSIENTTGNRYFDFEMYQTDIYYDRPSRRFYGYGTEAGHTSWQFDASGGVTRPGDIIFTAEYSSSALTAIEARIWIDRASLLTTPAGFSWTGSFDGESNGSQYGYAGIMPNTAGAFYYGLTNTVSTFAGPFGLIRDDNSLVSNYTAGQFMEFGVNLTKLGLDPVTLLGGNACGMPFRRVLVKSRASTSFTAELKDFVGPFDFFLAPRADIAADVPLFCGSLGVSQIQVTNSVSTSEYTWSTLNGHIVGSTTGTSITVDNAGTYVVTQRLQSGCSAYATDTVVIAYDAGCSVLANNLIDFRGTLDNYQAKLKWTVTDNQQIKQFVLERSTDGIHFVAVTGVNASAQDGTVAYSANDELVKSGASAVFYRLRMLSTEGAARYTRIIRLSVNQTGKTGISVSPNPAKAFMQVNISSSSEKTVRLAIYDMNGKQLRTVQTLIQKGNSAISIPNTEKWQRGMYVVRVQLDQEVFTEKFILTK
jgi:hypothetical protein